MLHFIFLIHASRLKGFISLSMRYASQAFRTLSLFDLMSLSGISVCNVDVNNVSRVALRLCDEL